MANPNDTNIRVVDIARAAGVSTGTVSNVLNRPEIVSPQKREAVNRAIKKLGYLRQAGTQWPRMRHKLIGMIVSDVTNPYYGTIIRGASKAASESGYSVITASTDYQPKSHEAFVHQLIECGVSGIIAAPDGPDFTPHLEATANGVPVVIVDARVQLQSLDSVGCDDEAGGEMAIEHLLSIGKRNIMVLGGPADLRQAVDRHYAAQRTVTAAGISNLSFMVTDGPFITEGYKVADHILSLPKADRPDAVFATSDMLAVGVLQGLSKSGEVRIPEDIAVLGYDDIEYCQYTTVPLSSIHQPAFEMGFEGAKILLRRLSAKSTGEPTHLTLQPSLSARASTGASRAS